MSVIVNIVIPNKYITCNNKDPPWLNDYIKCLINQKSEILKIYRKDGRPNSVYENLQTITWDLTEAIGSSKNVYYEWPANKLNVPNTGLSVNEVQLHIPTHLITYLGMLLLLLTNFIWQVNCTQTLQQVCSVILLHIIHLQFYVKLSFYS